MICLKKNYMPLNVQKRFKKYRNYFHCLNFIYLLNVKLDICFKLLQHLLSKDVCMLNNLCIYMRIPVFSTPDLLFLVFFPICLCISASLCRLLAKGSHNM